MSNDYKLRLYTHRNYKTTPSLSLDDYINYYDLTFVIKGEFFYKINDKHYTISSGNGILIRPGDHRVLFKRSDTQTHYYSLNFFYDGNIDLPDYLENCFTSELRDIYHVLENIFGGTHFLPLRQYYDEQTSICISLIIAYLRERLKNNYINPHLKIMLKYISEHYTERISLRDVAEQVSLSPSYCCNLFKQELNTSIYDVIMKERILLAQNYLQSGDLSLVKISELCGFNDYNHFSKYFKKVTGYLPSEYRKHF
ncbi:MAG: helix-turn-helix domain-containing protein [Clostridia bacterium]|nr:helix-turn-helix domain-containing protein [Clostridia bacterium]